MTIMTTPRKTFNNSLTNEILKYDKTFVPLHRQNERVSVAALRLKIAKIKSSNCVH